MLDRHLDDVPSVHDTDYCYGDVCDHCDAPLQRVWFAEWCSQQRGQNDGTGRQRA